MATPKAVLNLESQHTYCLVTLLMGEITTVDVPARTACAQGFWKVKPRVGLLGPIQITVGQSYQKQDMSLCLSFSALLCMIYPDLIPVGSPITFRAAN